MFWRKHLSAEYKGKSIGKLIIRPKNMYINAMIYQVKMSGRTLKTILKYFVY